MARGLNIYFIHSSKCDYNNLIYLPVLRSNILSHHTLVFSRSEENKDKYYDPKYQKLLKNIIAYNNEADFRYYVETFAETYKGVANKKAEENVVVLGMIE